LNDRAKRVTGQDALPGALETPELALLPCDPVALLALIAEPARFGALTGLALAPGLTELYTGGDVSPEWVAALRVAMGPDPWRHGFFIIHRQHRMVIGTVGFKGPPDRDGVVEVAYGIAPPYQGKGHATAAAAAAVTFAFASPEVALVRAHTLPEANASTRVLAKCGFRHVGGVIDPDDGPVWRWERERS
jgi:RimJ/RimL family protein N-acetyltransferase